MDTSPPPTGTVLRRLREDAGLSIDELAAASGVPRSSLYLYEAGGADPPLSRVAVLCAVLGASLRVFDPPRQARKKSRKSDSPS